MAVMATVMATLNPNISPTRPLVHRLRRQTHFLAADASTRRGSLPASGQPLVGSHQIHSLITCLASAGGDAPAQQGDDAAKLDNSSTTSEIGSSSPTTRAARPEDGYVGLFVRMLGLDNDPLDREQAVTTLWKYSLGGKECVDDIMKFTGCINLVVSLLKGKSSSAREAAAGLLRTVSSVGLYRESVAQSGAIEEIAGALCLASLTPQVIEQYLCTLCNLSLDEGPRLKIASSDILVALVKFLDNEDMKVKEAAGGVLANLSLSHCNHSLMVEAGVIPKLAEQLKCSVEGDNILKKEAKSALMELSKDEFNKILIIEEGLIFVPVVGISAYKSLRPVSRSWPSLPDGTEIQRNLSPSRYGASELLLGLNILEKGELEEAKMKAVVGRSRQQFLARIGAIESADGGNVQPGSYISEQQTLLPLVDGVARLVLILELEDISSISRAARAINEALISEEIRISFKDAGAVPRLIQLLDHCDEGVSETALLSLEKLSVSTEVCHMFEFEKLSSLISFLKSTRTSTHLKEKTVSILARVFNPGKVMKNEFNDKLINGLGKAVTSNMSSSSQSVVGEAIVDSDAISLFLEIMKTSFPNVQRKVASILEYLARSDMCMNALTDAGIDSALLTVLQEIPTSGLEEDDGQEVDAVDVGETCLVIEATSRLLTKLLDFEKFRNRMDRLAFVNALRKILKSSSFLKGKDWVAACLVKIDLMDGCGTGMDAETINVEVTLYQVIPRLVEQMKASPLESSEAALVELNNIISKGMVDCSRAIAASGGIFPLVNVIDKVNGDALEAGLAVLYNLSMDTENHAAIIAAGAVPVLRRIVLSAGPQWTRALYLLRTLPT